MHPIDAMVCRCCGHDIDDLPATFDNSLYHQSCRNALLHEREACAQVAYGYWIGFPDGSRRNRQSHRSPAMSAIPFIRERTI
jgi:hypothetical protein